MPNNRYASFFDAVFKELQKRKLIGYKGSEVSERYFSQDTLDTYLVVKASNAVWDVYCDDVLDDDEVPILSHIEQNPLKDVDLTQYVTFIFEDDVYLKVESFCGHIYMDTSGPIYPRKEATL